MRWFRRTPCVRQVASRLEKDIGGDELERGAAAARRQRIETARPPSFGKSDRAARRPGRWAGAIAGAVAQGGARAGEQGRPPGRWAGRRRGVGGGGCADTVGGVALKWVGGEKRVRARERIIRVVACFRASEAIARAIVRDGNIRREIAQNAAQCYIFTVYVKMAPLLE
jgi:hypothetical protein